MRLITHNLLKCNVRGVENGYPLIIEPEVVEEIPVEFCPEVTKKMLKRISWPGLKSGAANLKKTGHFTDIEDMTESIYENDEELLREIHHLLFEIHVVDGVLTCPESGRKFLVKDRIPNMLLHEDEV